SEKDQAKIEEVIAFVRSRLSRLRPGDLRVAAGALLALERLPAPTSGIDIVLTFSQPNQSGNYGWLDIAISADQFRLGGGEHFYDPAIGGDTESRTLFQVAIDGSRSTGIIDDWLVLASEIAQSYRVEVEDLSDYEAVEWPQDDRDE